MDNFDDVLCEGQNGAYFDEEDWETVYPSEFSEEVKPLNPEVKQEDNLYSGDADDLERLMWLPDVVREGRVSGEGTGVEVTGVVAAMLDNSTRYGFEFSFFEVEDKTPWDEKRYDQYESNREE